MKKQRKIEKDNRGVAIYARKSRITNKGDSIGVQFKQCADYAKKELGLDEDYEFLQYEDKGLSGYFSDRPDFQRMLHDVQDGKIKAIVCYKLDRVGRKTADLIRLMDFLEMYHVNLLICSNGINTASGLYKIFIQIFAVIAAQTRNLREADGSIKKFIQEDLQNLAEELRKTERQLSKLDEGRKNNMIAIRDLEMTKERLLSFAEYAKDAQPEVLVTLIQTIVERIYIVDKDDERYCHIFIKGCSGEDYTGFFRTAGYIEDNSTSVCDSEQCCICAEISTDGNLRENKRGHRSNTM